MQDIPNNGNNSGNKRIAMLIDGDNAQASLIEKMVAETSKYGLVTIRRVYGDWTTTQMKSWKDVLSTHAIQPIQQFQNTVGKNSTDSALIIDAMDILYEGAVNGFCLVSSDSDYTRLATRIREKGVFVMGIGRNTTPRAFVNACEVFVFTQNLIGEKEIRKSEPATPGAEVIAVPFDPLPLLKNAFDISVQEDGWAFLGTVGGHLHRLDPSFDLRTYGYKQLIQLIKAYQDTFEIRVDKSRHGPSLIYIRRRDENPA
ncbi:MAG: NYN domain-containing protein [Dehalococcoidales bacterium]|nr:NYN domain-containing protein [Dehalococcoidales bacterium]